MTSLEARPGRTARLAAALVARYELAAAVRVLNRAGILPMPLKGVLLQHVVYPDPADRMISDADVLVPPSRFVDALGALRAAGHEVAPVGRAGAATKGAGAQLEVDVHGRLFAPGLYGLSADDVFARGRIDETLIDGVVVVPDPLDLYAHLVGNFAKGRHSADDAPQLRDFSAVASRFALTPLSIATHLEAHGLARAARYALTYALESGDAHAGQVLERLRADPVGDASARAARALTKRFGSSARVSLVAPHLVNKTLPHGAVSVVSHVALGLRSRVAKRLRAKR